jgi:hypothetical protein
MPFLAPIFASVSAWVGGLGVIGSALVKIGSSLLLSAVSKALMPKAKLQDRKVSVRAAASPRDLVYGRVRKGGNIVFVHTAGSASEVLHMVVVFAGHQIQEIGNIYFNDELAIPAGTPWGTGRFGIYASCDRRNGTPGQPAFSDLASRFPDKWTASHTLSGCAAVYMVLAFNTDIYPSGIPNISADIFGKNDILDPRTGLRGYTTNAALCVADYMSLTDFSLGAQIGAADGIDTTSLIEAANICDEVVAVPGGGTEARYTCNGTMTLSETPQSIIEAMLGAMAGSVAWLGGAWRIRAGAYRVPTVTLTDNDVREGGMTLETRVSRSDSFNAVRGTFISPDNDWQVDDFPAYESATYLAEDGGERRWRDIALPFTISASMAQRLARIELEKARRQMTVNLNGKLSAWRVSVGGTAMLSYARWGMSAKPFDVESLTLNLSGDESPELVPNLVLRETSPLVYDWDATEAAIYAVAPRTTLPSVFDVPAPSALSVKESLYVTRDGSGVKALARAEWVATQSANVSEYVLSARLNGGDWVDQPRTTQNFAEILDIEPGLWSFRAKSVSPLGIPSDWVEVDKEIYGLGAKPVALTGANLQSAGGLAVLEWDQSPDLDVRIGGSIIIRHSSATSPTWANSISMKTVPGASMLAVVPLKPGAYILRARDQSGAFGPEVVLATDGIQAVAFAPVMELQADPVFSGAKVSVDASGGNLQLADVGSFDAIADVDVVDNIEVLGGFAATGVYTFASGMDFGAVKLVRLRSLIGVTIAAPMDNIDTRAGFVDEWVNFDGPDGVDTDAVVEARTTQTDPDGGPTWSDWFRVDSSETSAWGIQSRCILSSADRSFSPSIEQLRLIAEEVA